MGIIYKNKTKQDYLISCQEYAKSQNGQCLSKEYESTHKKLIWQCKFKHIWYAMPSNVKRGKWCPTCSNNKKLSINDCIFYAKSKDGYCLSKKYINSASLLIWNC